MTLRGAVLVAGSASGVGKSTVVAALCRSIARRGSSVAPFKAQNMSNHAAVTADGGEIGRAQAMQALAARVEPDRRMNPILLKPSSPTGSHLVVMGDEVGTADAHDYGDRTRGLRPVVLDALEALRREHDVVVLEGAGGAAEINLLDRDLVNLPLAAAAAVPALLVVDIDRGGAFASAHGTIDLLPDHLRGRVGGVLFNGFRGDATLLRDGVSELEARTGVPVLGVLPHLGDEPLLGVEDSLDIQPSVEPPAAGALRVAAVRLPHLANPSDLDPLAVEEGVDVRWTVDPADVETADLVVLPGSRATVTDLRWLRSTGLATAIQRTSAAVVGLCAGYQMLGTTIDDEVESGEGFVDGLGMLDVATTFRAPKIVRRSDGTCGGDVVSGYEIRWGRPEPLDGCAPWLTIDGQPEGARSGDGKTHGTSVHGVFDGDAARRAFLEAVARRSGRTFTAGGPPYLSLLDAQHERLADWLERHVDVSAVDAMLIEAADPGEGPGW